MKILVYEHVSGGGFAGQPIPTDVLAEGFGMLRTIVSDFKAAHHEITVLLDSRISRLNVPIDADCTVPVFFKEETKRFLEAVAKINDAAYIIAPETNRTLESLVLQMEQSGTVTLNCASNGIQKVADKALLYETLKEKGLPTPKMVLLNYNDDLVKIKRAIKRKLEYPLIFKPSDGVGCSGLSIVEHDAHVSLAIEKIKKSSSNNHFIAQERINGEAASVSLLSTGSKTMAISLNKQNVALTTPDGASSYDGGVVPFEHPLKQEAFALAEKVVDCFSGLKGYVGVDLVLTKSTAVIVDVNPRLTTSYVGLSKVAKFNVAQALVNAVLNSQLPDNMGINGFSCFSKIELSNPSMEAFRKSVKIREVVCPPFPIEGNSKSCGLVASYGDILEDASVRLEEVKKRLNDTVSRGK